jgi:Cellulase (glycosyl hydrolase family 5)
MPISRNLRIQRARRFVPPQTSSCLFGVNQVPFGTAISQNAAANAAAIGATVIRFPIDWAAANPSNGTIFWSGPDSVVNACTPLGIKVIFTIFGSPQWVSGSSLHSYIPVAGSTLNVSWLSAYNTFFTAVIARYGTSVMGYQIWNEPNTNYVGSFWSENGSTTSTPQATVYSQLFNSAYAAGKAQNSSVTIGTAGITTLSAGFTGATTGLLYIPQLITTYPITTPDFVAIHPYTTGGSPNPAIDSYPTGNSFKDIPRIQSMMVTNGWGNVPVWITEFGFYSAVAVGGETIKAEYVTAANLLVDRAYGIGPTPTNKAPVEVCCYFNLNNASNGTTDTNDNGLWTGTPTSGPNTILLSGTAYANFTKAISTVTSVSLFYNSAAATPMLLFTGTTYTMVAKDQSGNVLSGVGTWSTTDATNAPVNASTGVISPAAGIGGGTITYTHTASGKTASVVFSVFKTPGAIVAQGGISGLANTAALMAQISSSLGVDSAYNSGLPVPTGSGGGVLYRDGLGVNHFSIDTTTTSRQFMGSGVMVQTIPTTTPVSDGALLYDPAGGMGFTRAWGLQVFRFDPGFTTTGTGGGGASFKIGNWFPFSGGGRVGIELDGSPPNITNDCIKLSGASTVGGAQSILASSITTEFSGGGFWCSLVMYEVRGGNIMSSRVWWFPIGSVPTLLGGVTEGPMAGVASPSFTPPSPAEYQPTAVNYNQAPPVSQLNVSFPLWMLINGDTQGDPFGVLADASSPTLTGISGGTIARGDTADSIVLTGTNFTLNCQPKFSSAYVLPQSITINSSTQMTIVVAVNSGATPGSFTVLVNNQSSQANSATQPILIT